MSRKVLANNINFIIGRKEQIENDETIPEGSIIIQTDDEPVIPGKFTKVTVTTDGRVIRGETLDSADIPPIPISRVSGLIGELEAKAYYNPDAIARMTIDNVRQVIEWETADGSIHSYNLLVDKIPISMSFDPETNEIVFDQGEGEELRVNITHLVAGIVKSINNIVPDSSGNITLTVNDIPGIYELLEDIDGGEL
jgi:hypothetical protein